jgi:hypothetical protein
VSDARVKRARMKVDRNGTVQLPDSFRNNLRALVADMQLGEDWANLLASGDPAKLNERAVVLAKCRGGGQVVYRVFQTQSGRLFGWPARRPRGRENRDQHRAKDRVQWLDLDPPALPDDTVSASRCRCRPLCPREIREIDIHEAIAAGRRTITVR